MKKLLTSLLLMLQLTLCAEVYDCFTFFNELDLLKLRFEELYDVMDHFVIVESKISFTGKAKPLYFAENAHKFEKYKDKITHIVIEEFPNITGDVEKDHWYREEYSRNMIMQGLTHCKETDLVFISDLDEIPSASAVQRIKEYQTSFDKKSSGKKRKRNKRINDQKNDDKRICFLDMRLFMYQMNRENFDGWYAGSKAAPYFLVKKYTPWGIKLYHHKRSGHRIENGGWHFNTMGGKEKSLYKWLYTGPIYGAEPMLNELVKNEDRLDESYRGQVEFNTIIVPIDSYFPKYFLENLDYFRSIGWIAEN